MHRVECVVCVFRPFIDIVCVCVFLCFCVAMFVSTMSLFCLCHSLCADAEWTTFSARLGLAHKKKWQFTEGTNDEFA